MACCKHGLQVDLDAFQRLSLALVDAQSIGEDEGDLCPVGHVVPIRVLDIESDWVYGSFLSVQKMDNWIGRIETNSRIFRVSTFHWWFLLLQFFQSIEALDFTNGSIDKDTLLDVLTVYRSD